MLSTLHSFYPPHTNSVPASRGQGTPQHEAAKGKTGNNTEEVIEARYALPSQETSVGTANDTNDNDMNDTAGETHGAVLVYSEPEGNDTIAATTTATQHMSFLVVEAQTKTSSDDATEHTPMWTLLGLLARLAGPVALTHFMRVSMSLITTGFMGRYLTTAQFAAASTGLSFTNLTALNIGAGFCAALDTLATQEHGRRAHSPEIAAIFLRGLVCTFTVYIPMAVFYFFCDPVLALLIHEELVADTAYFLRMSVFIATPMLIVNNLLKFAQSQKVTQMGLIAATVGIVTLVPLLYIFRHAGIPGVIAALCLNRLITLATMVYYVVHDAGLRQCWQGRSLLGHVKAVLINGAALLRFVKVGLPVLGANCADSWAFEALAIVAAHLGAMSAAVWSVIMVVYSEFFALYIGVAAAGAIRIGNAVGAGKGLLARRYVISTVLLASSMTVFCVSLLWLCGPQLFWILQSNPDVAHRGREVTFLAGCCFICDSLFYVLQGPFRGVGYNGVLLFIVAMAMWGVAVPLSLVLGVRMEYDVEGLLVALGIGVGSGVPLQLTFLLFGVPWHTFAPHTTQPDDQPQSQLMEDEEDDDQRGSPRTVVCAGATDVVVVEARNE